MTDKRKQPGWCPNPGGKGGFKERPEDINRGGFTKEQRAKHYEQHDKALALRDLYMDNQFELLESLKGIPEDIAATLTPQINRMIEDAMDRNGGKAVQAIEVESPNGTMTPRDVSPDVVASLASKLTD